jgi:hypothetical protein
MTPETFATPPLRMRDQLEAWREWYHPVLEIQPKQATGEPFQAEIHICSFERVSTLLGDSLGRTPPPLIAPSKPGFRVLASPPMEAGRLGNEPNHRAAGLCLSDKEQP